MKGLVTTLRLGWSALLFQEDAYEEMGTADNPIVKGVVLIVVVGLVIALLNLVGTGLELASTPDLGQIRDTVRYYILQMPFWEDVLQDAPDAIEVFEEWYERGWESFPGAFSANMGCAATEIILTPLGLVLRWLIYGLLAYLFARWFGGTADLSETLGVLALAVAPQVLNVLGLLPFVEIGNVVGIWGILCAYVGLKTAHGLSWPRAAWAALLPFILAVVMLIVAGCMGTAIFAALVRGG